jgi:hypothetical protein
LKRGIAIFMPESGVQDEYQKASRCESDGISNN